ncbi:hypothetical protein [Ruegeria arenilitoris]|uniref:hypothetical protein n=1 Tax=Ruegeria arenilitoris TaxID=1173585 RepID=UPI00147CEF6E|nr:hypothetical protein [Ruegeria arenilitoris]
MELIADILLVAGALGAGLYCFVLAKRLKRFTDLERGVGGAVSVLSAQADELRTSLDSARASSDRSGEELQSLTQKAESVAQRLELMMASMHDVVSEETSTSTESNPADQDTDVTPTAEPAASSKEAEESSTSDAKIEREEDNEVDLPKAPDGLMFFRHARLNGGAAT